jgi:hypothetical protein
MGNIEAAPIEHEIGGRVFKCRPLTNRDIKEIELWLYSRYVQRARASIDPAASEAEKERIERVAQKAASELSFYHGDGLKILFTPEGMARMVQAGIKPYHPEVTLDELEELLANNPGEIAKAQETIARLGDFDGGDDTKPAGKKKQTASPAKKRTPAGKRRSPKSKSTGD